MKRLDSYLLTHYPLLWNLRIHLIWPAILILHVLFFIWGFGSASFPGTDYNQRIHPDGDITAFSVLLSILAGVGWLVLYFRNNALKSFYPLHRGRLALELLMVFLTSFALVSISGSHTLGKVLHLRQMTANIDYESDRRTVLLANQFLPFQLSDFSRFNECTHGAEYPAQDVSGHLPTDTFSYLNYCSKNYRGYDGMYPGAASDSSLRETGRGWMIAGRRDTVLGVLKAYLSLVKKYGGQYLFDPEAHVAAMFGSPGFELKYSLSATTPYTDEDRSPYTTAVEEVADPSQQAPQLRYGTKTAYVEARNPEQGLALVSQVRSSNGNVFGNIAFLYTAMILTVLIFSFRLTGMRTWFIAVIGAGLLTAAVGLMMAVANGGIGSLTFVIILEIAFTVLAAMAPGLGWKRPWAGVMLLWSIAGLPLVLPCVWTLLHDMTYPEYASSIDVTVPAPSPLHTFLGDYQDMMLYGNVFFVMVVIAACYIPLARKWQAMPEE